MLQRLYVHNFRCLENFELPIKGMASTLLIGKNGSGKSTIATALEVLQSIGRGINRVGQLIHSQDFTEKLGLKPCASSTAFIFLNFLSAIFYDKIQK